MPGGGGVFGPTRSRGSARAGGEGPDLRPEARRPSQKTAAKPVGCVWSSSHRGSEQGGGGSAHQRTRQKKKFDLENGHPGNDGKGLTSRKGPNHKDRGQGRPPTTRGGNTTRALEKRAAQKTEQKDRKNANFAKSKKRRRKPKKRVCLPPTTTYPVTGLPVVDPWG